MPAVTELAPWFALGIAVVFALVQVKLRRRMTALQVDCQRLGEQIAERDRALEAVRRSEVEARTRALIADHTDNLAVLTDAAGLTEWVNAAFERVTEYTLAEVVGKTPGSVLQGPATNPRTVLYMRDCLRRGQGFKTEILNYSKSGRKYWLALEVQPLHDARGQLVRFMAIESDITERKQAEAALRESEERFRQLVNHIDEVFWILDLKKSRILYVSPAFEQVWGRPIADLYTSARLWFEAVQMDDRPRVEQAFFHTVLTQPVDEEYRIVRPDGAVRWVRDRGFPVADEAGAVYRIVGVAQDVTEARQAREALRQAKEAAETANRFKSQFLANVSHEIRTPMNGILGMTELLLRESPDERQRERLDVVKISAEALLTVIDDLLDLSRMEAGKLVAAPRPFDLYAALGQVVKLLGEAAHRRGLELACQIAPDVPRQVIGDAVRLRQVLLNLVGNAVKFTEHGGVQVRVERLDADRLCFAVSDTGIGVPPDQLARIFQPFEQAEDTTQRRFGGTGLGLSIAARLVELLGGVIEAESTPGRGSTFRFTARLEPAAVTEVALDAGPDAALCGRSVLVVETNPLQQVALCDALADAGMRPVLARDPAAVARHLAAKAARFALVAIDLDGLGAEGPALVRRLGEVFGYRGPLLLLGKRASLPGAAWRLAAPAATVLLKPFTSADLLRAAALALQPAPPALESPAVASEWSAGLPALRVLIAEDNEVNQRVAGDMLRRAGHAVHIVPDGCAALAALDRETFDVVLMDLQMPQLNGLEATAEIRRREGDGRPRLPIVALTAMAVQGDEEKCRAAGMDGYVTKPIRWETLGEVLRGLCAAPRTQPALVDRAAVLARLGGQTSLVRKVFAIFHQSCATLLPELRAALQASDAPGLARHAHKLAGGLGNFDQGRGLEAVRELEAMGRAGELSEAAAVLTALEADLARLLPALEAWVQELPE